jgi:phosphoenolpyruvate synthase/pyruvate phosphate dikinase
LKRGYRDMQDIEFTDPGRQALDAADAQSGKRTAKAAALRIAVEMVAEGVLITRRRSGHARRSIRPRPAPPSDHRPQDAEKRVVADKGLASLTRRGIGRDRIRHATSAEALKSQGREAVILVRIETSPRTFTACMPRRAS